MTHHTATVTTDHGNTAIVDIASHAADGLAGISPVEGMLPSADLIAAKLSGRHFDCWADLNEAIADLVANDPGVFVRVSYGLYDGDTAERIGDATDAQVAASLAAQPDGGILIDADGDVVIDGTWAAQQPGVRKAYVA